MTIQRLKDLRGPSRRSFLQFAAAAGALLALDRSKVLDVLSDSAGSAMADDACPASNRSIHLVGGIGGFAWFQLLWPHVAIATSASPDVAFHAQGQAVAAKDTDRPFYYAPESPFRSMGPAKRITAFMAGTTEIHTPTPSSAATVGPMRSMLASIAAIQTAVPALVPVIGVNPVQLGAAPGAPDITTVDSAEGMVDLFNSAASRALLAQPTDAALYEARYKAFLGLVKAAPRSTWAKTLRTDEASANFLGKNFAAKLAPLPGDLARYGVDDSSLPEVAALAKAMITAVKAFALGLTQSVVVPAMLDDPHSAFADMPTLLKTVATLGKILDQTYADLAAMPDPACSGRTLADTTILTVHGDTPHDPLQRSAWPDGTSGDSNWLYVMGNGWVKTGWFGGIHEDGTVDGFDPTTGDTVAGQASSVTAAPAGAAVLYAVARGDKRRVSDFYSGPAIDGIVNAKGV